MGTPAAMHVVLWVVVIAFLVVLMPLTVYRLRRGGPGPQVNWVLPSMRQRVNRRYEKHGWQKPFNDDGTRNRDRSVL